MDNYFVQEVVIFYENQPFIASSTATATATVAPTMGLLPITISVTIRYQL